MKHIYLHDTHTIFAQNNELYLINDKQQLVINIDAFIKDLPTIIRLCKEQYTQSNIDLMNRIKDSLKQ